MPTPSEQKALAFVALVVLLGGVVRVVRAGAPPDASVGEQQALARQAAAAESAATRTPAGREGRRPKGGRRARPRIPPNPSSPISEVSTPPPDPPRAPAMVDLDRASALEIEGLPRIGPALARRIVANRDSFGSFGSLEALARVKGLGPATRNRLAPLVTFSGRPSSRP